MSFLCGQHKCGLSDSNPSVGVLFTESAFVFVAQAVRLESGWTERVRYMVVIYTNGHQDTEENIVLGMDFADKDR